MPYSGVRAGYVEAKLSACGPTLLAVDQAEVDELARDVTEILTSLGAACVSGVPLRTGTPGSRGGGA